MPVKLRIKAGLQAVSSMMRIPLQPRSKRSIARRQMRNNPSSARYRRADNPSYRSRSRARDSADPNNR